MSQDANKNSDNSGVNINDIMKTMELKYERYKVSLDLQQQASQAPLGLGINSGSKSPKPLTRIPPVNHLPYTASIPPAGGYTYLIPGSSEISKHKTSFEEVLDTLFTDDEKLEFILSVGYMRSNEPAYSDYYIKVGSNERVSLDTAFLTEISIKFKNLLLAKVTLKFKL